MHLLAEKSIHIHRPVSAVFEYVTNMEHFGDWFPGVIFIESANDHAHGKVGKEYRETVSIPLRGETKVRIVVREARQNAFFATEGQFSPLMPRMEIAFSQVDAGSCKLVWRMFSRNHGRIFRFTLLPLARRVMQQRAAAGVKRLRHALDKADNVATGT